MGANEFLRDQTERFQRVPFESVHLGTTINLSMSTSNSLYLSTSAHPTLVKILWEPQGLVAKRFLGRGYGFGRTFHWAQYPSIPFSGV